MSIIDEVNTAFGRWLNGGPSRDLKSRIDAPETPPFLQTVQVSLLTGRAVKGALSERLADGIVLKHASVADEDAAGHLKWSPADGEVLIPWAQVEFWQQGLDADQLATIT